jgi:hypothetical protein
LPIIYDTSAKAARMDAVRRMVAGGTLEFCTADGSVLCAFRLTDAAGSVNGDTWTLQIAGDCTATRTGRAGMARIKDASGTARISGLKIGMGSGDISISNTQINEKQTVSLDGEQSFKHA